MEAKRLRLQNVIGPEPLVTIENYTNFSKTQHRSEVLVVRPETLEHVQAVVRACRKLAIRVRAAGKAYTLSRIAAPDEGHVILYTTGIRRHDGPQMELITHLDGQKEIQAMTGELSQTLYDFQLAHDVAIPINALILDVTIGGLIAPFTNGTGREGFSINERISWMRIVDSDGNLRTYSTDKDVRDVMRAIQVNLGMFGIMYDVRIQVDPTETVRVDEDWVPMETVLNRSYLKELFNNNDHVILSWTPFEGIKVGSDGSVDVSSWKCTHDHINIRRVNRPNNPKYHEPTEFTPIEPDPNLRPDLLSYDEVLQKPELTPIFLKQLTQMFRKFGTQGTKYQKYPEATHHIRQWMPLAANVWYADAGSQCENVEAGLRDVVDLVEREAQARRFPANFMVTCRLIKPNDIYMCPARLNGSGMTMVIEVLTHPRTAGFVEFNNEVSSRWQQLPDAVTPWCGHWNIIPGIIDYLRERYRDQTKQFLSQLEKSGADPDGIFLNTELEKILYPGGHPGFAKLEKVAKVYTSQSEHCTKTSN